MAQDQKIPIGAQKYFESVSESVIIIVISNLLMNIVEREPSGFRITVTLSLSQPITTVSFLALIWLATYDICYISNQCLGQ